MRFFNKYTTLALAIPLCALTATRCDQQPTDNSGAGSFTLFVTDKPFPFDHIQEALVTITRVEVRREHSVCDTCDDDQYCNGAETCDGTTCAAGANPCPAEQSCDEASDTCFVPCADDASCNDDLFCTGTEFCADGMCHSGELPCDDGLCNEVAATCDVADASPGQALSNDDDDGAEADDDMNDAEEHDDHEAHEDDEEDPDDDDESDNAWMVVFEGEKTFNLLDLRNGRTDLLADVNLPAGTYTQIRLIVTAGEITLNDGRTFPLRVPSGPQTGIKLHLSFTVADGENTQLLLDVDLSRAFSPVPGGRVDRVDRIRGFRFSPSVAMRLINLVQAGRVAGVVTNAGDVTNDGSVDEGMTGSTAMPVAGASVTLFSGETEVTSTSTDPDGTYVLSGVVAGTYRVEFSANGFDDVQVNDVVVTAGNTTQNVDAHLTPVATP